MVFVLPTLAHFVFMTSAICPTGFAGGIFLSPCECKGTLEHVHRRCLCMWVLTIAEAKGPDHALRCDICRAAYRHVDLLSLTQTLKGRRRLLLYRFKSRCLAWWNSLVGRNQMIGSVVKLLKAIASAYAVGCGIANASMQMMKLPRIFCQSRKDPLRGLAPIAEDYFSLCAFHFLSRQQVLPQMEIIAIYSIGWLLDAATGLLQTRLAAFHLPHHVWSAAVALLSLPRSLGMAIQLVELSYVVLLGGSLLGCCRGLRNCLTAPLRTMNWTIRCFKGTAGAALVVAMHSLNGALRMLKHSKACS